MTKSPTIFGTLWGERGNVAYPFRMYDVATLYYPPSRPFLASVYSLSSSNMSTINKLKTHDTYTTFKTGYFLLEKTEDSLTKISQDQSVATNMRPDLGIIDQNESELGKFEKRITSAKNLLGKGV